MGKHISKFATAVALILPILFEPVSVRAEDNISTAKARLPIISAIKSKDTQFIIDAFAPSPFIQHVVFKQDFGPADLTAFSARKGELYGYFFDDKIVQKKFGKKYLSFASAFTRSPVISFIPDPDGRFVTPSISTVYGGVCYDIILNCNDTAEICEISGLNYAGCTKLDNTVLSTVPTKAVFLKRLESKKDLVESRSRMAAGVENLVITTPERKEKIYGPSAPFQVLFSGTEEWYGGVVHILVNTKENGPFYLSFRHLTSMNREIRASAGSAKDLAPGTFIGGNSQKIGMSREDEPARLSIDGRGPSGAPLSQQLVIQILQGKL